MILPIKVDQAAIEQFCRSHHIIRLAFFGSILTEHFGPQSDVDVLVDFDPTHIPNLLDVVRMEGELSSILGCKADLRTAKDLSRYFRDEVVRTALVQYAA